MIYTIGHKNPDADSVSSAIIAADLLTQRGYPATACKQGKINYETTYILGLTSFAEPITMLSVTGKDVWLVDHSDLKQAPDDLAEANLLGIVDHHRLGDIITQQQLEAWIWPVGCTATVLYNIYKIEHHLITKDIAILMMCAILSDTVGFLSATVTAKDKQAIAELTPLAGVENLDKFIQDLLLAKTSITGLSPRELVEKDLKAYPLHEENVVVGQIELASISQVKSILDKLNTDLALRVQEQDLKLAVLMLTDITTKQTTLLYQGEWSTKLDKFKQGNSLILENTLSRKKQCWPWLQQIL